MAVMVTPGDTRGLKNWFKKRRLYKDQLRAAPEFKSISGATKGQAAFVDRLPFRIGKGDNNQLVLKDPAVAGLHAIVNKNSLGGYAMASVKPQEYPILVRRWGRFRPTGYVVLRDKMVIRLGPQGPRVRYRFLGEGEGEGGAPRPQALLPETQVRTRLDQMFASGRLADQDRHYVKQASRHLATLHTYRKLLVIGCVAMLLLIGFVVASQIMVGQKDRELKNARAQLTGRWAWSQAEASETKPEERPDENEFMLTADRTTKGILNVMTAFKVEQPTINLQLVNMVKNEIEAMVEHLLRDSDLEGFLDRYRRYHPQIEEIFRKEYQLPPAAAYVAWIESEYYLDAESDKGALGMWQFTADTAEAYGLITDKGEDYRQDFGRSTRAAARYLSDLLAQFGMDRFMVALAAYNWGPDNVLGVFRRNRLWQPAQRTFPFLLQLRKRDGTPEIPLETRRYVPKFFAANLIGSDMSFYLGR